MGGIALEQFAARAMAGAESLDEQDIRGEELARARHALAYLKARIGNERMRDLLRADITTVTARVREWVDASQGRWQTGAVELVVPGPDAAAFHAWYERAMAERRETVLRAGDAPNPLHVARVTFEPGSRTRWHVHPRGQILIATSGIGRFQIEDGPLLALIPGDSVTISPREKHWHGAAPDQLFVHISIQAADDQGNQAIWLERVTEEAYARPPSA